MTIDRHWGAKPDVPEYMCEQKVKGMVGLKKIILALTLITVMLIGCMGSMGTLTASAAENVVIAAPNYVSGSPSQKYENRLSLRGGSSVGYAVNFKMSPSQITVRFGTDKTNGGALSLRADSSGGQLIGTIDTKAAVGSGWQTVEVSLPVTVNLKGEHSIWVCCESGAHDFYSLTVTVPEARDMYAQFADEDAFSDIADSSKRTEINLLADLGILTATGAEFDAKMPISRRELCRALAAFYPDSMVVPSDERIFSDVDKSDADYKSFLKLCSVGVLTPNETQAFTPSSMVSLSEGCELVVRVLSYDYLNNAGRDYISIARRLNLLKGVDADNAKALRRGDMVSLLYNALSADYAMVTSVSEKEVVFDARNAILSRTKNIYMATGLVSANATNNLYATDSTAAVGCVVIDGKSYEAGETNAQNYLGVQCTYFYEENNADRTIVAIRPDKRAEMKRFASGDTDFADITDRAISFYNEKDKIETLKLNQNTILMYNGRPAAEGLSVLVNPESFQGELLAFDNDADGILDVIIIEQPETILFGGLAQNTVFDILQNRKLTFADLDDIRLFIGASGAAWGSAPIGGVMDVYRSRNTSGDVLCRMYIVTETATGQVVSTEDDAEKVTLDNGETYEAYTITRKRPMVGQTVTLKLNSFGKYVDFTETGFVKTGVMFKAGKLDSGVLSTRVAAELLTEDNTIETIEFADKVYADGVYCKREELPGGKDGFIGLAALMTQAETEAASWKAGVGTSYDLEPHVAVRYTLNTEGKINMFDTPQEAAGGVNDVLKPLLPGRYAYSQTRSGTTIQDSNFNDICPLLATAKVANLWNNGDRELYGFQSGIGTSDSNKALIPYTTKENSMIADFVVWAFRSAGDSLPAILVDKITTRVDDEGDEIKVIHGFNANGEFEAPVSKHMYNTDANIKKTVDSLEVGDVIQVRLDGSNAIYYMVLHYLRDGAAQNAAGIRPTISLSAANVSRDDSYGRLYSGEIVAVEDDFVKIAKINEGESVTAATNYEYLKITGVKLALCEKIGQTYKISSDAGKGYAGVGSRIVVFGKPYYYNMSFAVVYR